MNISEYLNNMDRPCLWTHRRLLEKTKEIYRKKTKVKPEYYIFNNNQEVGRVYDFNNKKAIFIHDCKINLLYSIEFISFSGEKIEDDEVRQILMDFIFPPKNQ